MKLAVFDIDGTLVRSNRVEDQCYTEALYRVFGFEGIDTDWTKYRDVTDTGLLTEICSVEMGRVPTAEERGAFRKLYSALLQSRIEPDDGTEIPGASSFLRFLENHGEWCIAVATGNFQAVAQFKIGRARLPCSDRPMATADDATSRRDLVQLAIDRSRSRYAVAQFDQVVSIGDAPWDLRTAQIMELPFLAVGERCVAEGYAPHIDDYSDPGRVLAMMVSSFVG